MCRALGTVVLARRSRDGRPPRAGRPRPRGDLARLLGREPASLERAREAFLDDGATVHVVTLDAHVGEQAAPLAETTGARTLDALHLAAAQRAGAPALRLAAFDVRRAQVARDLGWTVLGV